MNSKQEAFVNEYVKDHNGAQSAIRAGYSKKTARTIASQLLAKLDIQEAIKERIKDKVMESDEVLTRLADIARGDMADLMYLTPSGFTTELLTRNENGDLVPKPQTKLIKKIKQRVTTIIGKKASDDDKEIVETEFELYSAQEALNTIAKLNGMITDKVDLTSKGDKIQPDEKHDRAISTLADALREIVLREGDQPNSEVDTPK